MRPLVVLVTALAILSVADATDPPTGPAIAVTPDPPQPGEPFRVSVTGISSEDGVRNASLKTCLAEDGVAQFCLLPVAMERRDDAFEAMSREGFGANEQVGVSVTLYLENGTRRNVPDGIDDPSRAYVFYTVAGERERPVPTASLALVAAALAAAVLLARRRG